MKDKIFTFTPSMVKQMPQEGEEYDIIFLSKINDGETQEIPANIVFSPEKDGEEFVVSIKVSVVSDSPIGLDTALLSIVQPDGQKITIGAYLKPKKNRI